MSRQTQITVPTREKSSEERVFFPLLQPAMMRATGAKQREEWMSLFIHRTACSDIKCEGKIFSCFRQVVFAVARIDKVPWWDTRKCDYLRGKRQQSVMFHPGFNAWRLWHIPPEATRSVAHLFGTEIKRNHSQQLVLTVNTSHLKRSFFKWILNHISAFKA